MCLYSNRSWATTLYKHNESAKVMYNSAILLLLYVVVLDILKIREYRAYPGVVVLICARK